MTNLIPEWLAVVAMLFMYVIGYCTGAMFHSRDPFWYGFREGYTKPWTFIASKFRGR